MAAQTRSTIAAGSGLLPALVEKQLIQDIPGEGHTKTEPTPTTTGALLTSQASLDASSIESHIDMGDTRKPTMQRVPQQQQQQQQHHFTDLAGLDVEGVLRFTLDTRPNAGVKKAKRKSGRRGREERERVEALLFSSAGEEGKTLPQEASSSIPHPQEQKKPSSPAAHHPKLPIKSQYSRGPRLERRARRLAELKAREREGEGLLFALSSAETDPSAASLQERLKWWRYAGLTFEDELPHYDSVRQAWVREVAEWLTVKEVRDLAECWAPEEAKEVPADSEYPEAINRDDEAHLAGPGAPATIEEVSLDADAQISRKSANRRKRQERRRAVGHEQDGHRRNNNSAYRPEFAPPPSSAVNIPIRNGSASAPTAQGGKGSHPLSRSQVSSFSDEDDEEEEDSFGMGLTLNIDEAPEGVPAAVINGVGVSGGAHTAVTPLPQQPLATSPSPSATSTITSLGAGSFSSPETAIAPTSLTSGASTSKHSAQTDTLNGEEEAGGSIESLATSGKMRFIVEAVLSLRLREDESKAPRRASKSKTARHYEGIAPQDANEGVQEGKEDDDDDDDDSEGMTGWTLD